MLDLETALHSPSLAPMLIAAAALGFLHTILGPDHYVPFVAMAKSQGWSWRRTARISFLSGLGHVGSSALVGGILVAGGMAADQWAGSRWEAWHESRASVAVWILLGLGAALTLAGLVQALRRRRHVHVHRHPGGVLHVHEHDHGHSEDHGETHAHAHALPGRRLLPWILFALFIFGPCESLVPLMLAAGALTGGWGTFAVTLVFSAVTVLTILGTVGLLMVGLARMPLAFLQRWTLALSGLSLVACGAGMQWLGW
jgi:hypothetical protein